MTIQHRHNMTKKHIFITLTFILASITFADSSAKIYEKKLVLPSLPLTALLGLAALLLRMQRVQWPITTVIRLFS